MLAINFKFDDQEYEIYNGKKSTNKSKIPKADIYLTDNLPATEIQKLVQEKTVLKCSQNTLTKFQETQKIKDRGKAIWEFYQAIPNAFTRAKAEPPLHSYYHIFKDYQKMRIAASNRLLHDQSDCLKEFMATMESGEEQLKNIIEEYVEKEPIYTEWLLKVKGIGPILASGLVVLLGDVTRFQYRTGLYSYAGYAVNEEGRIQKDQKGEKSNWNHSIKPLMFVVVGNLLKAKCPVYSDLYYEEKTKQLAKLGDAKNHAHKRAIRRVAKLFLSHYWEVSMDIAGLPTNSPWIIQHGGHSRLIPPPYWNTQTVNS